MVFLIHKVPSFSSFLAIFILVYYTRECAGKKQDRFGVVVNRHFRGLTDGNGWMARKREWFRPFDRLRAGRLNPTASGWVDLSASISSAQCLRRVVGFGGRVGVRGITLPLCYIIIVDGNQKSFPCENQDPKARTGRILPSLSRTKTGFVRLCAWR